MKLHGWFATREFVLEFWRSRESVAIYVALSLVWVALAVCAGWASGATGLGDSWSTLRQVFYCAGAATQILIGCAVPLATAADEGRIHMEQGLGCWGQAGLEADNVSPDIFVGLWVFFWVLVRFAGPWAHTWSPEWLSLSAGWYWMSVDVLSAFAGVLLWLGLGFQALASMVQSARTVSEKRWLQIEHDEIARVSKSGKKRGSGSPRL